MPFVQVADYEADWNPQNNANRIVVHIVNNPTPWQVPINTEPEFIAVMLMLSKPGVLVDTGTLDIKVPRRPAGT